MRRREEGIDIWLAVKKNQGGIWAIRLKRLISRLLGAGLPRPRVIAENMLRGAKVRSFADLWTKPVAFRDGLGALGPAAPLRRARKRADTQIQLAIREIRPLREPAIKKIDISMPRRLKVEQTEAIAPPPVISKLPKLPGRPVKIHNQGLLQELVTTKGFVPRIGPADVCVRSELNKFGRFPHIRRSVELAQVGQAERLDFLKEAEAVKGIHQANGEVLALFRRVPIEIISKIHFLENTQALLFTVRSDLMLQRTRVHDLAVVRDRSTATAHFVAHRTRFRMVSLS